MRSRTNQITITGHPGGGKTTAAKLLAKELGWEYFYTGAVQRQLAADMGISTLEFNKRSETDLSLNKKIDEVYIELNKSQKPLVIDARLAWYFMPNSFKVRFEVPVAVGAQRVFEFARREDEQYRDLEAAAAALAERRRSERTHYHSSYGIDVEDHNHFDLILDTAYSLPERNVSFVRAAFSLWYKGIRLPKHWLSPQSLIPTRKLASVDQHEIENITKSILESGYDTLASITAVIEEDKIYIVDGHKRVAAALRAQCDFLPVVLIENGAELLRGHAVSDYIARHAVPEVLSEWKTTHSQFLAMPISF